MITRFDQGTVIISELNGVTEVKIGAELEITPQ